MAETSRQRFKTSGNAWNKNRQQNERAFNRWRGAALVALMGMTGLAGEPVKSGDHPGMDNEKFSDTHGHFVSQ
jgi:hypothetical protein